MAKGRWFEGKVVVVAGASAGIGRAVARAFGREEARVGLIARTEDALENAASELRAAGGDALVLPLDLADAEAVDRAADAVVARFGALDVWVNDAMVSVFSPVAEMRADEYRRVTEVNDLGTVHGTLAALRHVRSRGTGTIRRATAALAASSATSRGPARSSCGCGCTAGRSRQPRRWPPPESPCRAAPSRAEDGADNITDLFPRRRR